jgi:hypothetical protein
MPLLNIKEVKEEKKENQFVVSNNEKVELELEEVKTNNKIEYKSFSISSDIQFKKNGILDNIIEKVNTDKIREYVILGGGLLSAFLIGGLFMAGKYNDRQVLNNVARTIIEESVDKSSIRDIRDRVHLVLYNLKLKPQIVQNTNNFISISTKEGLIEIVKEEDILNERITITFHGIKNSLKQEIFNVLPNKGKFPGSNVTIAVKNFGYSHEDSSKSDFGLIINKPASFKNIISIAPPERVISQSPVVITIPSNIESQPMLNNEKSNLPLSPNVKDLKKTEINK